MGYSKRWELVLLLGGKCVDCGNENFYDLEIDHIFNDGDGERKYYTLSEKNYLANPKKARERLTVRCKICHVKRHNGGNFDPEHEGYDILIFPALDGKIIGNGTYVGESKELLVFKIVIGKSQKLLRHIVL